MANLQESYDDVDGELMIPLQPIYEEMCCPICFDMIDDCHITPCGHNFCKKCVLECLNREHVCPCCRAPCTKDEARKNRHVDKLIEILREEKKKAAKLYFENLIKQKPEISASPVDKNEVQVERSPIEQVFQKYMSRTMGSYQSYFKQLEEKFEKQKSEIRDKLVVELTNRKMVSEQTLRKLKNDDSLSSSEKAKKAQKEKDEACAAVAALSEVCNQKVSDLQNEFNTSVQLLVEAYERYLEAIKPTPKFIPLTINVSLPAQKTTLKSIRLESTDTIEELKTKITERLVQLGNPIHDFGPTPLFTLHPLFVGGSEEGGEENRDEGVVLKANSAIVLCCDPPPPQGSVVTVEGDLVLESDRPKECFTQLKFAKGESKCTYYTCTTCNMNWVCATCAEVCHVGHVTKMYLADHKPNWACCYCVKYKKCTIVKKKK